MLQSIEEITPTIKKLKINISSDVIEGEIVTAYNSLQSSIKIHGFRVGKVPQAILEKKFAKDIEAQVVEKIIPEFYSLAIKEAQITPVTYPHIEDKIKLIRNQPLSFTVTVEVKPKIEVLYYEGIKLKERAFSIEEEEIESALKALQESRVIFKVSDNEVEENDLTIVDYDALIDGKIVEELSAKGYPLLVNEQQTAQNEFSSNIVGKKKGDIIEFKKHFDDNYTNKTIAGRDVLFKIHITEVKRKFVPAIDNEFVKDFGCNHLEELKKKVHDDLYKKKKDQINMEYKKELLKDLVNSHEFDVPPSMLKREIDFLVFNAKENAIQKGETPKSDDELRKEHETIARENVKGTLILETIGEKEKIEVTEADTNQLVNRIAEGYNITPEEVKKFYIMRDGSLDSLKSRLYVEKVLDFLLEKAVIKV
ncbi:MAG: trigger factor [Nitrospirae bacterium]|nr:trigger factor [Nitrospirota bacterium]